MLLINTTWFDVVVITVTSMVGMYGVCFGLSGFKPGQKQGGMLALGIVQRVLSVAGGLMLIYPGWMTDIAGCVLVGGVMLWQKLSSGEKTPDAGKPAEANA